MKKNKQNNDISILEGFKIIIVCLTAIAMVSVPIGFGLNLLFKINIYGGVFIGLICTILIIILTGAWKPANANDNSNKYDDDED